MTHILKDILMTKISYTSTQSRGVYPWLIKGEIPMDHNFLLQLQLAHGKNFYFLFPDVCIHLLCAGWMKSMSFLVK